MERLTCESIKNQLLIKINVNYIFGVDLMKFIALIGGDKKFSDFLSKILTTMGIQCYIHLDKEIECSRYYEYVILQSEACTCNLNLKLNTSYYFINMDEFNGKAMDIYGNIITYGFGNKNTVTVSSIDKETHSFIYCLQRYLNHNAFAMIQPEEISIDMQFEDDDEIYGYMLGVTIAFLENGNSGQIKLRLSGKN